MHYGCVRKFNRLKGFGFITTSDEQNVFVHVSDIIATSRVLHEGQCVYFELEKNLKGLRARNVRTDIVKPQDINTIIAPILEKKRTSKPSPQIAKTLTPLMIAARDNKLGQVMTLILKGYNLDDRMEHGATALMYAAANGNTDVIELLLKKGANPYSYAGEDTALSRAKKNKHSDCVKVIEKHLSKMQAIVTPNVPRGSNKKTVKPIVTNYYSDRFERMKGTQYMARDQGQFGSFPLHDEYDDESQPDTPYDNEWYDTA